MRAASGAAAGNPPERRVIGLVCLIGMLIPLNSTMIAVALPDVVDDLDSSVGTASWLVSGYLIAMASLQPLTGKLGDRVGRRPALAGGVIAFGAASAAAAAAPSMGVLIALRVAQAVAGAVTVPNAVALVRELLPPDRRGRGFGSLSAAIGLGAAAGLPLGGVLVGAAGWPAIFLVNLPLVVLAAALAWRLGRGPAPASPGGAPAAQTRFDYLGAVVLSVVLAGGALLIDGLDDLAPVYAAAGAAALAGGGWALVRYEMRHPDPALQPRFFGRGPFAVATAAVGLGNLAMYGTLLAVPILFTSRAGWSSTKVGVVLAAFTLAMVAASPPGGRLADRLGRRPLVTSGLALFAAGLLPLAIATDEVATWVMVLGLFVGGIGVGLAMPALQAAALDALDARDAGAAAGVFSTARYFGSIVAAGLLALLVGSGEADGFGTLLGLCVAAAAASAALGLLLPGRSRPDPAPTGAEGAEAV